MLLAPHRTLIGMVITVASLSPIPGICAGDPADVVHREALSYSSAYGEGIAAALKGAGKRQVVRIELNKHDPNQRNEVIAERLPDIEIVWLRPGPYPDALIRYSLTVSKKSFELPTDLSVGFSTKKDVLSRFGRPKKETGSSFVYHAPSNLGFDILTFSFRDEVLINMQWQWAID